MVRLSFLKKASLFSSSFQSCSFRQKKQTSQALIWANKTWLPQYLGNFVCTLALFYTKQTPLFEQTKTLLRSLFH
jgi:hypothetical protein